MSNDAKQMMYISEIEPPPSFLVSWERNKRKVPIIVGCIAEAFGTFIYTYLGLASNTSFVLGTWLGAAGIGSVLQTGLAFAAGIAVSIIICLPTSGGFLNPGFTIYAMIGGKIKFRRGCSLVLAEIVGSFIACLLIYAQWKGDFDAAVGILKEKGIYDTEMFTPSGPAGAFAMFLSPQTSLGYAFLTEFMVDFTMAVVIMGAVDPTNPLCPPAAIPWLAGFAYAAAIWGFAAPGVNTNMAKDLGGRMVALIVWGKSAGGGPYAAISALTSIPASILGGLFYKFFLADHTRALVQGHQDLLTLQRIAAERAALMDAAEGKLGSSTPSISDSESKV